MNINWDNSRIEDAARVLLVINPGGHTDAQSVEDHIRTTAERTLYRNIADGTTPSYVGTGGWYVTFYQSAGGELDEWRTLVTIMPYAVNYWLERNPAR